MKFVAGILGLCGIGMFLNAIAGDWAFNTNLHGTKYVLADIGIGVVCFLGSYIVWRIAVWRDAKVMLDAHEIVRRREEET